MNSVKQVGEADVILRTEMEYAKAELVRSEGLRVYSESFNDAQSKKVVELEKQVRSRVCVMWQLDDMAARLEETKTLKSQLDEHRHVVEQLRKAETSIDKFKKRIEETVDLKKHLKVRTHPSIVHFRRSRRTTKCKVPVSPNWKTNIAKSPPSNP